MCDLVSPIPTRRTASPVLSSRYDLVRIERLRMWTEQRVARGEERPARQEETG